MADASGLTKGYISKIENSHKAPPFSTLNTIAKALQVDLTVLISENLEPVERSRGICIVRADEKKVVIARGSLYGYNYMSLAYKWARKNMEPYIIEPAFKEKAMFSHEGEEFMYVLEGRHEFIYGKERHVLEAGDSIYFDSSVPHSGRSLGKQRAKVLGVMYSYRR